MLYLLGIITFISMALYDYYGLKQEGSKKKLYGILGFGGLFFVSVLLHVYAHPTLIPITGRIAGGVIVLVFGFLLVYSLFLEIPFKATYGGVTKNHHAVTTGTYALCRHPGVLWLMFLYLGLYLATQNTRYAVAMFVFTIVNVIYVMYQERFIFNRLFINYHQYVRETPFLIPTTTSIKRALQTLFKH